MTPERLTYYFNKYNTPLRAAAIAILQAHDSIPWVTAQDVVSDAFVQLATRFEGDGMIEPQVRSWLYVNVRNSCFNMLMHYKRRKVAHGIIASISDDSQWDATVIKAELYNAIINEILQAIEQLPVGQRMIFKMVYIERLSQRQICSQLKIKAGTINVQIMKAKRTLRERFKGREVY